MTGNNSSKYRTILLTGVTGFLGSNLLKALLENNFYVIGLKRSSSDIWRIKDFLNNDNLELFDIDKTSFENIFKNKSADILIHSAWSGVKADERKSITKQIENFDFAFKLYTSAISIGIKKIISFGSQAEYGKFEGRINEDYPCNPTEAYGLTKLFTNKLLQNLSEQKNIVWFWIRLFSLFGPKEDSNWLIPHSINKMLNEENIDLTICEQKYDYLYIEELCKGIILLLESEKSGIYNFSSNMSVQLKEILLMIKDITKSNSKLNFGALQYRDNQIMNMEGDSTKLYKEINFNTIPPIKGLIEMIYYYKKNIGF